MSFMNPDIQHCDYFEVETNSGSWIVPADLVSRKGKLSRFADYVEGNEVESAEFKTGYLARLSASGYMDCTEWSAFDTEVEAIEYLLETYNDGEDDEDWAGELQERIDELNSSD